MKLRNLLALPIAVVADICTIGTYEVTDRLIRNDYREREMDAIISVIKIIAESKNEK